MKLFTFVLVAGCWAAPVFAAEPVVSVWYRGNPAGQPRQSDLGAIRALGFTGVAWPRSMAAGLPDLERMAAAVGLQVVLADRPVALTPASALQPSDRVDIVITPETAAITSALAWRAVAYGARAISFDAGARTGAGLEEQDGRLKPWARAAIALARQLGANARLADRLVPGPGVIVTPGAAPGLDVKLLDAGRSWVIVATNTSRQAVRASVRLPAGSPYAIWISWLDGTPLSMADEPAGPRWALTLPAGAARVYIIDKTMK